MRAGSLVFVLLVALSGCGGCGAAQFNQFEKFCVEQTAAMRQYQDRCGIPIWSGSSRHCTSYENSLKSGRMRFDQQAADACLEQLRTVSCATSPWEVMASATCAAVLDGTVALGEACHTAVTWQGGTECTDGFCFRGDDCPATCQPFVEDGCESRLMCAPGSRCDADECVRLRHEGEACGSSSTPCAAPFRCLPRTGSDQTCQLPLEQGAACDVENDRCTWRFRCVDGRCTDEVEGGECWYDSQCDAADVCAFPESEDIGSCEPGALAQEPCDTDSDCTLGLRCTGLVCVETERLGSQCRVRCPSGESCADGRCIAWGVEGAECAAHTCFDPLWCDAGSCAPPRAAFGACDPEVPASCIEELACDPETRTCIPKPMLGERCNSVLSEPCADGLVCACVELPCYRQGSTVHERFECSTPRVNGASCEHNTQCASGDCESGVCAPGYSCNDGDY